MNESLLWRASALTLLLLVTGATVVAVEQAPSTDDRFLDSFIGHWEMRGELGGTPAHYHAAAACVVATGHCKGEVLLLVFPYTEGRFRDTFTRHSSPSSWSLLIESQAADGSWSTFARYEMTAK